jgi:hypothetical protein
MLKTPKLTSSCPFNHFKHKDRGVRKNRRGVGEKESHGRNGRHIIMGGKEKA